MFWRAGSPLHGAGSPLAFKEPFCGTRLAGAEDHSANSPEIWTNGENQPRPENRSRPTVALSRMPDRLGPIDRWIGDERSKLSLRMAGLAKFESRISVLSEARVAGFRRFKPAFQVL